MPFVGTQVPFNRMLGYLDQDDSSNVPIGLAAMARNCFFELTSVRTRDGLQLTMQGINKSPITGILGLLYSPETATESFIQLPTIFDLAGALQFESPLGSSQMNQYTYGLFIPPKNAQMIAVQADNKGWATFTDLNKPLSGMCSIDPKTKIVDPYGMKPYGWQWTANQPVLVGEMCTPPVPGGNGHTYRCIQAGITGSIAPVFPTTDSLSVSDGTAEWQEWTAVMANRLPNPLTPTLSRVPSGGTFSAGLDVYIIVTFVNSQGESLFSTPVFYGPTILDDAILVSALASQIPAWMSEIPSPYTATGFNVYVATVSHGGAAPAIETYEQALANQPLTSATLTVTGPSSSGIFPPTANTARITPGQLPTPDVEPVIQRVSSAGSFPAGRDVYVLMTYRNANGETPAGPAGVIVDTEASDAIQVNVAQPLDANNDPLYTITTIGIYEADVPTGDGAPASSLFQLVGYYAPGAVATITASATGVNPPTTNTTGPGGAIVADTATGGINGGQGYRYAAVMFMNRSFTVSGFTQASVIQYDVDLDGYELGFFHIPVGPSNVVGRPVAPSVADGSSAGPFFWIGNYNPQIPSANFVYPQTFLSDNIPQTSTFVANNLTTAITVNFTDEYLEASNDVTDRLRVIWPNQCTHCYYSPAMQVMFQTGVPGYYSTTLVSIANDIESYYGDTMAITVGSDDGQRAWGVIEYRDIPWLMRERSGFTLQANPSTPNTWIARRRWEGVGPCGPRAFDSSSLFMIFVHDSGIYKYEDTNPDLMTKEIPYFWQSINWAAAETIACKIDEVTHQVHFLFPVNGSPVPNLEVTLNYLEGWQNPIHYSTYSGKEISMDACRKYSINDIQANVCDRIYRDLPLPPDPPVLNPNLPQTPISFYTNQWVYGSSGPDGGVQAQVPGQFNDNGNGIDWQYETVSAAEMMTVCKLEGFNLNANGNGPIYASFLSGRKLVTDFDQAGQPVTGYEVKVKRPIDLVPNQSIGISRAMPGRTSERWRMRFTNNRQKDVWASLKFLGVFVIPIFSGRDESERGS